MRINGFEIGKSCFIIAEIGNNHEGDFETAKMLVEQAAEAGVNAVKFQTLRAEKLVARSEEQRFLQLIKFELSNDQYRELAALSKSKGLIFISTPFDFESADMLDELVPVFKIASGDLTNHALIDHVARKDKPVFLSTGMGTDEEIAEALETIKSASTIPLKEKVVLLHCISSYPTPIDQANLLSIPYLRERFNVLTGYSDHTLGALACQTAVALGACVIEKHFTYRKKDQVFRDHHLSLEPGEMAELVENIRQIEKSLGQPLKGVMDCERANQEPMRRSVAARRALRAGEIITRESITFLRPANGIPARHWLSVIGRRVLRDIQEGMILREEDLQ
ncbi:MAG: N-acetylneuraminate synthase family protein [Bacillota bacterium]